MKLIILLEPIKRINFRIKQSINEDVLYFDARDDSEINKFKVSKIDVTGLSLMDIEEEYADILLNDKNMA